MADLNERYFEPIPSAAQMQIFKEDKEVYDYFNDNYKRLARNKIKKEKSFIDIIPSVVNKNIPFIQRNAKYETGSIDDQYRKLIQESINKDHVIPFTVKEDIIFFKPRNTIEKDIIYDTIHGSREKDIGLALYQFSDTTILNMHGTSSGELAYKGLAYTPKEIIQHLEDAGLIPENTKQIFTLSCYGGLQDAGTTKSGIPFMSSHNANVPVASSRYAFPKVTKDGNLDISDYTFGVIPEGYDFTSDFKQTVIDSNKKYGDTYLDISLLASNDEIEDALWPMASENYKEIVKSLDYNVNTYDKIIKESEDYISNMKKQLDFYDRDPNAFKERFPNYEERITVLNEEIENYTNNLKKWNEERNIFQEKKEIYSKKLETDKPLSLMNLSPQEAFDKYGPNSEKFYISQGLDPKTQRQKINELNSKRIPTSNDPLDNVKETKEFRKMLEEKGFKSEEDYYADFKRQMETPIELKKEPIVRTEPKIKSSHFVEKTNIDIEPEIKRERRIKSKSGPEIKSSKFKHLTVETPEIKPERRIKSRPGPKVKSSKFNRPEIETPIIKPERKYKSRRGPEIKSANFNTNKEVPFTEVPPTEIPKSSPPPVSTPPKTNKKPKVNPEKNINKPYNGKSVNFETKKINGKGKLAIGIAITGAIIGTVGAVSVAEQKHYSNKQNKKIHKNDRNKQDGISINQSYMYQDDYYSKQTSYYDNMYAMQMAQDISSYRYGKHMTGFVNG